MKKIIPLLLFLLFYLIGFSATRQVTNAGFTFSPDILTIQQGDDVNFTLSSSHDAVEVSESVWNASGNSPVIGFSVPFGGGAVSASALTVGTHYYVCSPHASFGMKGRIVVQAATEIQQPKMDNGLIIYPTAITNQVTVQIDLSDPNSLEIKLFDTCGKLVGVLLPKTFVSGTFSKSFQLSKQTVRGVYAIQVSVGDRSSFKKVVVL